MEKARESLTIEFMIMMSIMIWVILIKTKISLGQFLVMKNGLIPDVVELEDFL